MGYKQLAPEHFSFAYSAILSTFALSYAASGYYEMINGQVHGIVLDNDTDQDVIVTLDYIVSAPTTSKLFYTIAPTKKLEVNFHQHNKLLKKAIICAKYNAVEPTMGALRGLLIA